ncbi:MAG: sigma-70 family RNA polymerase sigma factor, partial [Anaerovorax sp.]
MPTGKETENQVLYNELVTYIQAHQESFYRLAYSYAKNREMALDMVQNAIYNALRSIHTLKDSSYIKTWFYRILINASIDELRKNKRMISTDPSELPEEPVKQSLGRDELLDLYAALDQLDEKSKTMISLRFFEDMKLEEVA